MRRYSPSVTTIIVSPTVVLPFTSNFLEVFGLDHKHIFISGLDCQCQIVVSIDMLNILTCQWWCHVWLFRGGVLSVMWYEIYDMTFVYIFENGLAEISMTFIEVATYLWKLLKFYWTRNQHRNTKLITKINKC